MGARHALSVFVLPILYLVDAPSAHAGGFMLQEQSPREIGRAFSGAAAAADNPSTIFYNPAGMTELDSIQVSSGGTLLFIESRQQNLGTTRTGPGAAPTIAVSGGDGGNPFASVVPVPSFYASAQVNSRLWLGVGISAPFGLKLRYDDDFFARYDSVSSKLTTINIQPSVAFKANDSLSVGAGLDVQYADATLTGALPSLSPTDPDGTNRLSGDAVSFGWNLGVLASLNGGARIGVHYRSGITHMLKGSYSFAIGGTDMETPISSPLSLPGTATASLYAPIGRNTALMLTVRHYNWSRFKAITVILPDDSRVHKYYRYNDSWSLSAGLERQVSERLTLRAGAMFDRTPTNPRFLSTRVPDGNRTWVSGGLSLGLGRHMTLDASYAHVFVNGQTMLREDDIYAQPATIHVTNRTHSSGNVDMIAASVTAHF